MLEIKKPQQFLRIGKQLDYLFDRESITELPLIIDAQVTGHSINISGKKRLAGWAKLEYLEKPLNEGHLGWSVFAAVSQFARKPTKTCLVEQLEEISHFDPDGKCCGFIANYPWQIAVCIQARRDGYLWREIIDWVDTGSIGNEEEWLLWEEENTKGIPLVQFRSKNELLISNEMQGKIYKNAGWSHSGGSVKGVRFAAKLTDAIEEWPEIANQESLVNLCCFSLFEDKKLGPSEIEAISRFISTCCTKNVVITSSMLAAILLSSFPITEKSRLLAKAGRCSIKCGWLFNWEMKITEANNSISEIIGLLMSTDEWPFILRAISFFPPLETLQQIPELVLILICVQDGSIIYFMYAKKP